MGTRHVIAVVKDGEYKIAQYGQWDGYPEGQGKTVLNFLQNDFNRPVFEENLKKVKFGKDHEIAGQWKACGADDSGFATMEVSNKFNEKFPENSRDTGAKILSIVQNLTDSILLFNSLDFVGNSLFCEWAYVIDLDKNTFEVYKGLNKNPLGSDERFASIPTVDGRDYKQVKHFITYDLNSLPTESEFFGQF